jgi:PAS domain S-box-containing protein
MIKKVLIVDDNSANLYLLETLLKGHGLAVTAAANGRDALDKAHAAPPDLLITDILMPVMDGYALCREWKADERLRHIPLVFYTATYTEAKDEEFALSLGADRFIIKPQEPDVFMNLITEFLGNNYAARQVKAKPLGEEMEFFRQHNEILFNKLEKKMMDLETTNQKLKILEERYRLSFENISDVVYTIDTDLNILEVSPSVERILGYKREDFVGLPLSAMKIIFGPESFEQAVADAARILRGETIPAIPYRFISRDGTEMIGEVSGAPLKREGRIIGMIAVGRDVTAHRRAEEALRESEAKYRGILESMDDAYFELDIKGNYTFFNDALLSKTGYSRSEIMGMNYKKLISAESRKKVQAIFKDIYETGQQASQFDYKAITKDGQVRYFESWAALRTDHGGRPVGFRGMASDITQRKTVEKELQRTLDSLRKAVGTTIRAMASAVEVRDPYTAGHQLRVSMLACAIATEMGFDSERSAGIKMAGTIHDLGKLSIPAEILSKPTRLTKNEYRLVQDHAHSGYEILKHVESPWPLAEIIYQHHERMDGSGYPRKLKGNEILMEARIMAVADVVESMLSHRPYRPALGVDAALQEIQQQRGTLYDPNVVDACIRLFREKSFKL